jgi:glucokinase
MDQGAHLILAGDVGGTKTELALFRLVGGKLSLLRGERFPSADFPGLDAIVAAFLGDGHPPVLAAGFGVPGVVRDGRARPTNLSWEIDASSIAGRFGIPRVSVLNDLAANAHGIAHLPADDFAVVQDGHADSSGNRCVVSPGTGLGEAGLFQDGHHHRVWACEGGHADFAPRNDLEIELLRHLIARFGHVSAERVISGSGLPNIYRFLRDTGRGTELPEVARGMESEDAGAVISRHADAGTCPMCGQTMDIFISCLGAEAANMALKTMATGGVYLGGGIPVKLLHRIRGPLFLDAFHDKGRLSQLMRGIPVLVVLNDKAALLGAAHHALDQSMGRGRE